MPRVLKQILAMSALMFQACVFDGRPEKNCWFIMQAQDAATAYFFKLLVVD